jgi:hypothetical protein
VPTTTSATTGRPSPATSRPTLYRQAHDRSNEAEILTHLGDSHEALGDLDSARDAWRQALVILEDLDHPDAAQLRAKLR